MILAVDIGNTNVTCGVYDGKKWVHTLRLPSTLDFWNQFFTLKEFGITESAISSVVPDLTQVYIESIQNLFQIDVHIITYQNSGVELLVDTPKDVGVDRICNVAAAEILVGAPAIVGDIGSATNYDVVDEKGAFIGGAIAPGIEVAAHNLIQKAALLKETAFSVPELVVGKSTESNLQSGIMLGAIDVVDGMFTRIMGEMNWDDCNKIVTGGFGGLISPHLKTEHNYLPNLTLDGIRIIYENN
ncbi:type III pantothenate kinase [Candidatus Marinimicrobia bacterium PRS2]|nr:type III pantothenate kinase [Candidatus Marinimicrobia bacterium PRS2]